MCKNCWECNSLHQYHLVRDKHIAELDMIQMQGLGSRNYSATNMACNRSGWCKCCLEAVCSKKVTSMELDNLACCTSVTNKYFLVEACNNLVMNKVCNMLVCCKLAVCNNSVSGIAKACNRSDWCRLTPVEECSK